MNEQLQEALAELLGKANNGIDTAGDFLASELPAVIQQLLMWHGVKSFLMSLLGIIGATMLLKVIKSFAMKPVNDEKKFFYKKNYNRDGHVFDDGVPQMIATIFGGFFSVVLLFIFIAMVNIEWLQIWIAPKAWLIEYAAKLAS